MLEMPASIVQAGQSDSQYASSSAICFPACICAVHNNIATNRVSKSITIGEIEDIPAGESVHSINYNTKRLEDLLDESDADFDTDAFEEKEDATNTREPSKEDKKTRQPEVLQEESVKQKLNKPETENNGELVTAAARSCEPSKI